MDMTCTLLIMDLNLIMDTATMYMHQLKSQSCKVIAAPEVHIVLEFRYCIIYEAWLIDVNWPQKFTEDDCFFRGIRAAIHSS